MSNGLLRLCDYTLLDPEGDIEAFLADACEHDFAAICVLPEHVAEARSKYTGTIACAAGGFPNGDGPLPRESQRSSKQFPMELMKSTLSSISMP